LTTSAEQRRQLDLLAELNRGYQERRQNDALLEARVQSFELAYRMQMETDDAFDLSKEPEHIHKMYGEGLQARQMIIARRLLECGVRFVQVWHGAAQPWDSHDDIRANHGRLARECDQPIAGLIKDLKQRGMLDDTLVIWDGFIIFGVASDQGFSQCSGVPDSAWTSLGAPARLRARRLSAARRRACHVGARALLLGTANPAQPDFTVDRGRRPRRGTHRGLDHAPFEGHGQGFTDDDYAHAPGVAGDGDRITN
jgi:hypothetical protein